MHLVGTSTVSWDNSHCVGTCAKCLAVWHYTLHPQVTSPTCPTPTPTWIRAEQGLFQQCIWHMTMTTQILTCPTSLCSFPQVHIFPWTLQRWPRSHQQEAATPVRNVHGLPPIPNQTGLNPWHLQNPQSAPPVLGPQESVQLFTQRAREALHDQRNGSTCSTPSTKRNYCCHSSIWSGCEAKPCQHFRKKQWSTQLQRADASSTTRNKKQMRDFSQKTKGSVIAIFSGSKSSSWKSVRQLDDGSDIRSMETRRDEQVYDLRTELRLQAPHQEEVTQDVCQEHAGPHQHLTGLVPETAISRYVWRISSCSFSHRTRNWTLSTTRSRISTRSTTAKWCQSKIWCSILEESDKSGITWIQNLRRPADYLRFTQRSYVIEIISCTPEILKIWKYECQSLHRDLQTTQESLNVWDEANLNSIQGVCWWTCRYVDHPSAELRQSVTHHKLGATPSSACKEKIQCRKQLQNWLQLRVRKQRTSRNIQWQYTILLSRRLLHQWKVQKLLWQSLILEGLKRKKQRQFPLASGLNQQNSEVGKLASKAKSLILRNIPEPLCCGLARLRMSKVLTSSLLPHLSQGDQCWTSRILISNLLADSGKS